MNINKLIADSAEKFKVGHAISFADHAKHAQSHVQFSQLQNQSPNYFKKIFISRKNYDFIASTGLIYLKTLISKTISLDFLDTLGTH